MFQDEGRFGCLSDGRACWAPKGVRPEVREQQVRGYVYAFSAVAPTDGRCVSLILPRADTHGMNLFLECVADTYPKDRFLMFMDKAGWHVAKGLKAPKNIVLDHLPPYSPQCNPVEQLWKWSRTNWFHNLYFKSLTEVEDALEKALLTLSAFPPLVQSLCGFPWIRALSS